MTIQPNPAGTHLVFTISWAAPDTDEDGDGVAEAYIDQYGNGEAELDRASNLEGGNLTTSAGQDVQYIYNGVNTVDRVQWTDPANYTVGDSNPTAISREWRNLGGITLNAWVGNTQTFGSGEGGVNGAYSPNPDGTGATTGTGVGINYDWNSASSTDFGFLLSGVSDMPNRGYIQVQMPVPTTTWRSPTTGEIDFGAYTYDSSHPFLTGNLIGPVGDTDKFIEGIYTVNSMVEVVVTADPNYAPKLAVPGDFDSDLDVDNVDLDLLTGNFAGAGSTGLFYADGDMDADGDVDNADIGAFIGIYGGLASSGSAELTYDRSTGNVTLDASAAAGAIITSFQLENAAGSFLTANHSGLSGGDFGTTYQEATANALGDSDPSFSGFSGIADLGNVFPTGMNLAALEAYLTTAVYTGTPGTGQQEFDLVVVGTTAYQDWSDGSNFEDDDNGDGVKNGIAFILGAADPNVDAVGLLPVEATEAGYLTLTFNRVNPIGDAVLSVEYGGDLTLANTDVIPAGSATLASGVIVEVTSPGAPDPDTVVVKVPDTFATAPGNLFARLKATETTEN